VITALDTKVQKIAVEVQALKDSLANTEIPAAAQTALDNLTTHLQAVDDLNPDTSTAGPAPTPLVQPS
jgi:hypothetical protein